MWEIPKPGGACVVPDPLFPSATGGAPGKSGPITLAQAQKIQGSPLPAEGDRGKRTSTGSAKPVVVELAARPEDSKIRLLAIVIYAESTTEDLGGEDAAEKDAIGATFMNRAHYATLEPANGKGRCYNTDFGDGTLLSAIQKGSVAVGAAQWNKIASDNDLKPQKDLEKVLTLPKQREHYNLSVEAAQRIAAKVAPITISSGGIPVGFNQSEKQSPSSRMEHLVKLAKHHFWVFKKGRECS